MSSDPLDIAFTSRLILLPEHNWGLSTGKYLKNPAIYSPAQLRKARYIKPEFQKMDDEWHAKRRNVEVAVMTLPPDLQKQAQSRLRDLTAVQAEDQRLQTITPDSPIETEYFAVKFDDGHGALVMLHDRETGREWASSEHPLSIFQYETFTSEDFARFNAEYNTQSFAYNDFGKPGMNKFAVESRTWKPVLRRCALEQSATGQRIVSELHMPEPDRGLREFLSWPDRIIVEHRFPRNEKAIHITLQCLGKKPNRLAEAMWFSFSPDAPNSQGWILEKSNHPVSPLDVMRDGNRHMHAVTKDIHYHDSKGNFTLETFDAPIVAPGQRMLLNFNNQQPDMRGGVHINLYNNLWGTAFPQWYGQDMKFRFVLRV